MAEKRKKYVVKVPLVLDVEVSVPPGSDGSAVCADVDDFVSGLKGRANCFCRVIDRPKIDYENMRMFEHEPD